MPDPAGPPAAVPAQDDNHTVVRAAGLIGVATLSSRILGFIRDMVLARLFGATPAADAFFVAYRIPNLLRELFAEGSMSSAFIPVFTEYHAKREQRDAWELASAVFTTLLTILTGITLLGILASPAIVWLLAPGFHQDPARLAMTTLLTQIMFPYLLFISLAALAMGVLNSLRAFAAPAFSPVLFNVCTIAAALFLSPLLSEPILGVAVGVVVGGAAQFVMQLPGLKRRGFLFGWRFEPGHPGVKRIGALLVPSLLGMSVTQINITVSTVLASFFAGAPTYLFYGMRAARHPGLRLAHDPVHHSAGDGGADSVAGADRPPVFRARDLHRGGHGRDGDGALVLCRRPVGLRRGADRRDGLLFDAGYADAGSGGRGGSRGEPGPLAAADGPAATCGAGPGHGPGLHAERG
nr:murein biosynthesis integral membrane protein MurJ [Nitrospirota bacterium]